MPESPKLKMGEYALCMFLYELLDGESELFLGIAFSALPFVSFWPEIACPRDGGGVRA